MDSAQTRGPEDAAAVERQPGQQVEDAHQKVGRSELDEREVEQRRTADLRRAEGEHTSEAEGGERPDHRDRELPPRRLRFALDLGKTAEELQRDCPDGQTEPPGHEHVRDLVHQDRGVQQHGEPEGRDEQPPPQPGNLLVDPVHGGERDDEGDDNPGKVDIDGHAGHPGDLDRAGAALLLPTAVWPAFRVGPVRVGPVRVGPVWVGPVWAL